MGEPPLRVGTGMRLILMHRAGFYRLPSVSFVRSPNQRIELFVPC